MGARDRAVRGLDVPVVLHQGEDRWLILLIRNRTTAFTVVPAHVELIEKNATNEVVSRLMWKIEGRSSGILVDVSP